ncbi:hypothetical protein H5T52_12770 [Candidatus Bipolaricaulota bacterium]|nr:hypothetical protein [Candidatus Bipolaricaulota bacterium]
MLDFSLAAEFRKVLEKEPRLIRLPPERTTVFVGDTHGDREATEEVLRRYFDELHVLVFLGDFPS